MPRQPGHVQTDTDGADGFSGSVAAVLLQTVPVVLLGVTSPISIRPHSAPAQGDCCALPTPEYICLPRKGCTYGPVGLHEAAVLSQKIKTEVLVEGEERWLSVSWLFDGAEASLWKQTFLPAERVSMCSRDLLSDLLPCLVGHFAGLHYQRMSGKAGAVLALLTVKVI